jgi:electron transport complex, rnfABCDGE type, B subunit
MIIAILVVVAVGIIAGIMLSFASKVFFVPVDETAAALREVLPGANCGGCGFAGCDAYASAMAEDRDMPCNKCPVGGPAVAAKLAAILGVEAGSEDRKVAVVMCNGNKDVSKSLLEYQGPKSCKAAKQLFGGLKECQFGCLGLGDCVDACNYDSIRVINGVAKVDRDACVACGACAKACPQFLIRISPVKNMVICHCHSTEKGGVTRKACEVGCIGCKKCESVCKFDSVHVTDNLAFINPDTCKNCGACAKVCPTGVIQNLRLKKKKPAAPAPAAEKPAEKVAAEA